MLPRLKFQIAPLVKEMLDRIPASAFTSSTTTFLDPAMAGGQFIVEIIRKLRYNGHTDENIASRVYGLAEDIIDLNYARKVGKLIGKYSVGGIEQMEEWIKMGKKFDVVIGNPPYQADSAGRAEKLWPKFIELAHKLTKDGGISALVTPTSWMSGSGNIIKGSRGVYHDVFKPNQLTYVNLDVAKYFSVNSTFCYYILENKAHSTDTVFATTKAEFNIDLTQFNFIPPKLSTESISINHKTLGQTTKFNVISFTAGDKNRKQGVDDASSTKTIKTYIRGSNNGKIHYAFFDAVQNAKVASSRKVIIPLSGAEKFMPYIDEVGIPHCMSSYVIPLDATDTFVGAMSVFNSRVFRYLMQENRTSGFVQVYVVKNLPAVDLTRSWTDAELYAHFKLTQEEIDLIEATVK